ncbi:MAG: hypothetical protein MZV63_58640 [Marinilabiliales bacterium]|nr:hypothetical protein [Marinilabiliales bacterium]
MNRRSLLAAARRRSALAGLVPVRRPGHAAPPGAERAGRPAGHRQRGLGRDGPAERDPSHRGQPQPQGRGVPDRLFRVGLHPGEAPRVRPRRTPRPSICPSTAGRPGTPKRPSCGPSSRSFVKIADLDEVPACLCSGSATTDTTAELVYVGPGNRDAFYKDKNVEGKVLLVNGPPEMARRLGVQKYGAAGLVGWSSSHPEFDRDEVGWSGLRLGPGDRVDLRLHGLRAAGPGAPGRPGARPARSSSGPWSRPSRSRTTKDQLTVALIKGHRAARRGARLHRPPLRGLGQAGRQRQRLRVRGRPGDGPGPEDARRRGQDPAAQAVGALPLRSRDLGDRRPISELNPDVQKRTFANINLDMVGRGADQEPELQPAQPDALVAADLSQRRHGLLLRVDGRFPAGRPGDELEVGRRPGPDRIARSVLLPRRALLRRERPRRLRRRLRPHPGRADDRLARPVVPHERRHARQVRRDAAQAGRDHLRGRGRVPGQRRSGRGREDDGRDLGPPGRAAGRRPGAGRTDARRGRRQVRRGGRPRRPG